MLYFRDLTTRVASQSGQALIDTASYGHLEKQITMLSKLIKLRQYTEEEWDAVRPIIEHLYIRKLRSLASVMQTMETKHQFKAR